MATCLVQYLSDFPERDQVCREFFLKVFPSHTWVLTTFLECVRICGLSQREQKRTKMKMLRVSIWILISLLGHILHFWAHVLKSMSPLPCYLLLTLYVDSDPTKAKNAIQGYFQLPGLRIDGLCQETKTKLFIADWGRILVHRYSHFLN